MTVLTLIAPVSKNYAIEDFCESICEKPQNLKTVLDIVGNSPVLMGKRTYEKFGNLFVGEQILFAPNAVSRFNRIPTSHSIKDAMNYFYIAPNLFFLGEEDVYLATINRSQRLEMIRSDTCSSGPITLDLNPWRLVMEKWKKENPYFSHLTYERKQEEDK